MSKLTHFDQQGQAHMVDVGTKEITERSALAQGTISMQAQTLDHIREGKHKKGDVLGIARLAGIMAAKKTADIIPLCHPLMLTHLSVQFDIDADNHCVRCSATAKTRERTGVEMEALSAVNAALLTIYDMCKAIDRGMTLNNIHLVEKTGGKSGDWNKTA